VYVDLLGWWSGSEKELLNPAGAVRSTTRASSEETYVRGDGFGVVGQLDAVRGVPGGLLRDLLAPWGRECSGLGLDLRDLGDEELGLALVQMVGSGRARLPRGLLDALDRIEDMADEPGLDAILGRLEATNGGPDWPARGLSPLSLAIRVWVEQRDRFEEAEIKRQAARSGLVREYPVREGLAMQLPSPESIAELTERVGRYWQGRGRGDFCRVLVFRDEERVYLPIHRGDPWKTEPAVEGDTEAAVTFQPRASDLAAFDLRTGRLMVKARDRGARAEYLTRFGEALFGDPDAVAERPVVTLEPLVARGRDALAPTPGLRSVELVALRVALHHRRRSVISINSEDVLDDLDDLGLLELGRGELLYAKFLLRFPRGHRRKLELGPPNEIAFDRRKDEHVVQRFLEERGFVTRSGGDAPTAPVARTGQLGLWG